MFNARIQDNSSKCNIIKHSLLDDLLDYSTTEVQNNLTLNFNNGVSSPVSSRISDLGSLVNDTSVLECWQPLFIDHDNFVKTKMLSDYGSYKNANPAIISGRIGIEDFYTFKPEFKHWTNSGGLMSIDWLLNKANCSYAINYGILGWYRIADPNNSRSIGGIAKSIEQFPNSSRLKHSSQPNKVYIKISDDLLYDTTFGSTAIDNAGSWTFKAESNTALVEVSTFGTNAVFSLSDIFYEQTQSQYIKQNVLTSLLGSNGYLWIPDGDFFSYYYSDMDKNISLGARIPSASYISSSLYNNYSNIYRIITLDEPRLFSKKNLRKARAYKKLAHALSTSPFIYDFSIHALDYIEVRKIIQQYLNSQDSITSISQDISILRIALVDISKVLQTTITPNTSANTANRGLFLDTKFAFSNFSNNLITNQQQLFNKLINKYGAKLLINGDCTITPKANTMNYNNDGIVISQILDSYIDKNTQNSVVSNSQKIVFNDTIISANTSPNEANILSIINGSNTTVVPLVDCAKPGYGKKSTLNIALLYKGSVGGVYRNDGVPFNPNGSVNTYIFESDLQNSVPVQLSALEILPETRSKGETGQFNETIFLESKIGILWEQISGPKGFFAKINGVSGITATTTFYANATGKFVVQCTAATPFGTYRKRKTFYVVDGRQILPPDNPSDPPVINSQYGKYLDRDADPSNSWVPPPNTNPNIAEETPIYLNTDNLTVQISKINSIGINNMAGVVWPIKTNLHVREDTGALGRTRSENIFELSGDYKFTYKTSYSDRLPNPNLQLLFSSNNTVIKIHSIFLEKIRTNETGCENCLSFYEPKMTARNEVLFSPNEADPSKPGLASNIPRYYRGNKAPAEFVLVSYKQDVDSDLMIVDSYKTFIYPNISTKYSPTIKSYGGYTSSFITNTTNTIPGHPLPRDIGVQGLVSNNSIALPIVSGYKLDYPNDKQPDWIKMCYQTPLMKTPPTGSIIKFTKGVLHPASGWIPYSGAGYQIHANKCGLLKFNPGARDSFSFVGPSLSSIKNNDIDIINNKITNTVFSSTISLSIAQDIQWDPECSCGRAVDGVDPDADSIGVPRYNDNQIHKEYADIHHNISNHGYRNLAGGIPKQSETTALQNSSFVNDEFLVDHDTNKNIMSYSFAVTGPAILPTVVDGAGRIQLRNPRVNDFGIKDIEVKLNFLNYVNTKNLVVWLEVEFDDTEKKDRYPTTITGKPASPIRSNAEFIDQSLNPKIIGTNEWSTNIGVLNTINSPMVYDYLSALTEMNSSKPGETFKLYLLNQENIDHNTFNFSVKFSDNANKYNTPYDVNYLLSPTGNLTSTPPNPAPLDYMVANRESFIKNNYNSSQQSIYQNVIRNNDTLPPTVAATGFTDRESCIHTSILKHNRLNITNNTFSKFVSKSLFKGKIPSPGPCPDGAAKQKQPDLNGATKFTLKMMVLDETDDMYPSDNINYQYIAGLDSTENNTLSSMIMNSLCNWELILHVGPSHKPTPHTSPNITSYGNSDVLSLINYDTDPQYPGYSFIADLSAYKHLLPIANLNAPYSAIADSSTCLTDNGLAGGGSLSLRPPNFPTYAILQIINSITMAAGMSGGTLVGILGGLDSIINNPGWNAIYNWFREVRFFDQLQDSSRELYTPVYDNYPFGSPEKILLLFKKPDSLWYNAEATILKYHNTPILKPNKYKFIRVQRGNGKHISEFKYTIVDDYNQLIDTKIIKNIDCRCSDVSSITSSIVPTVYNGILIQQGDLVNINATSTQEGGDCPAQNDLYLAPLSTTNTSWTKITNDSVDKISHAIHFSTQNSIICGGKPFFDTNLISAISGNKVIIAPTRIPYDIFAVNDKMEFYDQGDSSSPNPQSLITASVVNKALVFKDNKYFSVFSLDSNVASGNVFSPRPTDHIFFVFDNKTSIEDKITKQYNIWGLDRNKQLVGSADTDVAATTHSVGSYGDLSLFIDKNLLSNNIRHNHLETYHTIFNNKVNDKIKYNQIKIYDKDNIAYTGFKTQSCYGFAYSEKDLSANLFDTKNLSYYITPEYLRPTGDASSVFESLHKQIELSTSNTNEIPYRYGYIKANVNLSNVADVLPSSVLYGELTIENDFVEHIPIRALSSAEITQLQTRLQLIDDESFTGVDSSIGIDTATITVLQSNNLPSILKHYKALPDDPSHCYRPNSPNKQLCYKQKTEQKINDLYLERKEIIDLLDYQTIRIISLSYTNNDNNTQSINGEIIYENDKYITIKPTSATYGTKIAKTSILTNVPIIRSFKSKTELPTTDPRYLDPSILPKISPTIKVDPVTQAIIITYDKTNLDHYWINIDPKQSTFKDFEKNPRILTDTTYTCRLANPLLIQTPVIKNNVCPFLNANELPEGSDPQIDISFSGNSPNSYSYVVNALTVENNKTSMESMYPAIKGWRPFSKVRYFNINGDQTLDIAPALEIIVRAEENYLVPITNEDLNILEYNDKSADTYLSDENALPGIEICPGGSNFGSPDGNGLLDRNGDRIRKASRVCNIVNLDNTNQIDVMIKRIPRLLRGVDLLATIYRYGFKNTYRQVNPVNPLVPIEIDLARPNGAINNSLYYWTCFQKNPNSNVLEKAQLPDFFLLQNEMMFRAFFGSVDKIENRTNALVSYFPWELIPYEYSRS